MVVGGEREKKIHQLFYSPNIFSMIGPVWSQELRTQFMLLMCVGRSQLHQSSCTISQGMQWQEAWIGNQSWDPNAGTPLWIIDFLISILITKPNLHSFPGILTTRPNAHSSLGVYPFISQIFSDQWLWANHTHRSIP